MDNLIEWQPTASIEILAQRANILEKIRHFFSDRGIMEVETPLLCQHAVTDPYLHSLSTLCHHQMRYLQTSPEYCMKRLLAAGSGSIYQICKAFRQDELGRFHNPEFTLLEWYHLDYDHLDLMNEVDALLQITLNSPPADKITYQALFLRFLNLDPLTADTDTLMNCCAKYHVLLPDQLTLEKDLLLQCLMSEIIEPQIGKQQPIMIYHYPASQAALAKLHDDVSVAERFEVYYQGIELANGFHELTDAKEQLARFENNNSQRQVLGLPALAPDPYLLSALAHGLPDCAGVALGIDRLMMLSLKKDRISDVLSFDTAHS